MLNILYHIFYDFIGYASCHQIKARSLCFDGRYMFVCCRCSAIYIGYFISYLFIYITRRNRASFLPPKNIIITGIIISSFMFFDVFSVLLNLREGANDIRILTGFLAGMSFPFLLVPLINRFLFSYEEKMVIDNPLLFLLLVIVNFFIFLFIKEHFIFLFWPFFFIIASGLVMMYVNLNTLFILIIFRLINFEGPDISRVNILSLILSLMEILSVYLLYKILGVK